MRTWWRRVNIFHACVSSFSFLFCVMTGSPFGVTRRYSLKLCRAGGYADHGGSVVSTGRLNSVRCLALPCLALPCFVD